MKLNTQFQKAHSALQQGDLELAQSECRLLLRSYPDSRDGLALMALTEHRLGNHQIALAFVEYLLIDDPKNLELLRNRAALLGSLGRLQSSLDGYLDILQAEPEDQGSKLNLGLTYIQADKLHEAVNCYVELAATDPDNHNVLRLGVRAYFRRGHLHEAIRLNTRLLEKYPADKNVKLEHAMLLTELGESTRAIGIYEDLLANDDGQWRINLLRGLAVNQAYLGQTEAAAQSLRQTIALKPTFFEGWRTLSTLVPFSPVETRQLKTLYASEDLNPEDTACAAFALGRALESEPDKSESMAYYIAANRSLREARTPFEPELRFFRNSYRTVRAISDNLRLPSPAYDKLPLVPVFIVGLPRSGTTLVERVLSAHSQVGSAGEVNYLQIAMDNWMLNRGSNNQQARKLIEVGDESLQTLRQSYCQMLAGHGHEKYITDKWVYNFLQVGLIARLFPESPIIYCRKAPLANAFSIFSTYFALRHNYTTDFGEIAEVIKLEREAMSHWQQELPGRIFTIQQTAMVEEFESMVTQLLDYCGLDFEEACMEFYKSRGSVKTASTTQVRQPVNDSSDRRFEQFRPWLGDLEQALLSAHVAE